MGKTSIEWTEYSWNPVTGCTKVSEGCRNCYAERMARRLAGRYGYPEQPHHFDVTLHPDRLEQPLHWKKPRMVFPCSMSDLFHRDVPFEYIARVWAVMHSSSRHTFQILTKRPRRGLEFLSNCREWEGWVTHDGTPPSSYGGTGIVVGNDDNWPLSNVWLGVSVENQAAADERIPLLLQCPAAVRFVSCEPLLEAVDLWGYLLDYCRCGHPREAHQYLELAKDEETVISSGACGICDCLSFNTQKIDWLIVGGESGPGARPMHPDWARSLRDQAQASGTPYFFKQWGAWAPYVNHDNRATQWHWFDWDMKTGNPPGDPDVHRLGKKAAGRLLDGRTWDEMPEVRE